MKEFRFNKNDKIFFSGICGIGMSGIARILKLMGYNVSGSDPSLQEAMELVQGIPVTEEQETNNVSDIDVFVHTSAVKIGHKELDEAQKLGKKILHRSDAINAIITELKEKNPSLKVIIATGSHGKTSVSSMLVNLFNTAKTPITAIVGGVMKNNNQNFQYNEKSEYIIIEGDESDGSFLKTPYDIGLINNIDFDHLDFYKSKENQAKAFFDFTQIGKPNSTILIDKDSHSISIKDKASFEIDLKKIGKRAIFFNHTDIMAAIQNAKEKKQSSKNTEMCYDLNFLDTKILRHNASAILNIAQIANIPLETTIKSLTTFEGTKRRFDIKKHSNILTIIDDYAHHPAEVETTIDRFALFCNKEIAKNNIDPEKVEVNVAFEPHRYTRYKECFNDFVKILQDINKIKMPNVNLFILPIYSAWQTNTEMANSSEMANALTNYVKNASYFTFDNVSIKIEKDNKEQKQAIWLFMGAGNTSLFISNLLNQLSN